MVVVVGGGVVVVVVDGGTVVILVVGGGVMLVVEVVDFWHPMIEVIKTKLTRTRRKSRYLLFINAPPFYFFKFRFSNILFDSKFTAVNRHNKDYLLPIGRSKNTMRDGNKVLMCGLSTGAATFLDDFPVRNALSRDCSSAPFYQGYGDEKC